MLLSNIYSASTWQIHFAKEFTKKQYEEENPFYLNQSTEEDETATQEALNYFDLDLNTQNSFITFIV